MKLLADENIEIELVAALRAEGFTVTDIKEISPGIKDPNVLRAAFDAESILLTNDKDFGELVFREKQLSNGVILLRLGRFGPKEKFEFLLPVLREQKDELIGSFAVISDNTIRIRRNIPR